MSRITSFMSRQLPLLVSRSYQEMRFFDSPTDRIAFIKSTPMDTELWPTRSTPQTNPNRGQSLKKGGALEDPDNEYRTQRPYTEPHPSRSVCPYCPEERPAERETDWRHRSGDSHQFRIPPPWDKSPADRWNGRESQGDQRYKAGLWGQVVRKIRASPKKLSPLNTGGGELTDDHAKRRRDKDVWQHLLIPSTPVQNRSMSER